MKKRIKIKPSLLWLNITSFSFTTILHGNTHKEFSEQTSFTLAFNLIPLQMARILAYKAMDINNFDNIRRRLTSLSKTSSRSPSISSTTLSILYYKKMEINNDLLDKEFTESVDSSQLSYKNNSGKGIHASEATDNSSTRNQ